MYQYLLSLFERFLSENDASLAAYAVSVIIIAVTCVLVRFITKTIVVRFVGVAAKRTKTKWDNIMFDNKLFHSLSNLTVPIIIKLFSANFPQHEGLWQKIISFATLLVFMQIINAFINSIDEIYRTYEISKTRPIRGFLQVVKIIVFIIGGIVSIAMLIGQSPLVLLGGIGAMTAVTSLIFKDAILGFVAGIQLTANDMVRIGDWVEMPKYSANGDVVDMTLTTVKIKNFDKTITTIPTYAMVSDSFINWRGMEESGGRRIKRSLYIDAEGIRFCDEEMLSRFSRIALLKDYLAAKQKEVQDYNASLNADLDIPANGRRLTNIGTFRAYIQEYLKHHPGINRNMTLMVRQLSPTDTGIPLEIYAFTNTTKWTEYEAIQSDIFDHLYAIIGEFGLSIYQQPSGRDIRERFGNL